ncbi:C6 zinc finger domain-containing protein [Histoplasma capsulatum var. duboisii H88]|uniref:C6 zinc finger domain-containing protein n=1 Tax=Ajellomyces capsulatus (strain H88) TaxID=544711 RepID=A0A8A1LRM9_AJEC8|nr:C6 zinc finger domain-containing protein [Histoplasma capsulatum var. duboisii H88]
MSNDPTHQGQYPPPTWSAGQPDYPPSSQHPSYQYPPPSTMATIQPHLQHPPQEYQLPPPHGAYQRPADIYGHPAPAPPPVVYPAAAPRQRTAIACRYCRRRKIRCSGFESSQDGRCSNCVRFNQECMFTPVSSQAQAFVPAQAVYNHFRTTAPRGGARADAIPLYGAHGQPLPPPQPPQHPQDGPLPPPQSLYPPPAYGRPLVDERPPPPHLQPPPMQPDHRSSVTSRDSREYNFSESTTLPPVSTAVSGAAFASHTSQAPYDRRSSSHSQYSFEHRHSSSPHGSTSSNLPYPPIQQQHPPPSMPIRTPPPGPATGSSGSRGLSVREMLGPDTQVTRSSTDSDMLNALNRRV